MTEIKVDIPESVGGGAERSGLSFVEYVLVIIDREIRDSVYYPELKGMQRKSPNKDVSEFDVVTSVTCGEMKCKFVGSMRDTASIAFGIITLADLNGLTNEEMLLTMLHEGSKAPWVGKAG